MAGQRQCPVDQGVDDRAGQDVAEMTAGHADGGGDLRQNVEGGQHRNGLRKAFQIAAEAVRLDLMIGDEGKHQHRPGRLGGKICRGAVQAHQADQVRQQRQGEQRRHKRGKVGELFAHVAHRKVAGRLHQEFRHRLPLAHVGHLHVVGEPQAQAGDNGHDEPGDHQRGRNGNAAEDGNGEIDRCALNANVHASCSPPSSPEAPVVFSGL